MKKPVAPVRAAVPPPAAPVLNDCPTIASSMGGGIADLMPLSTFGGAESPAPIGSFAMIPAGGMGYLVPGIGDGGGGGGASGPSGGGESGPSILPPISAVPQPASWAMMVTGFGIIGLALRKGPGAAAPATDRV